MKINEVTPDYEAMVHSPWSHDRYLAARHGYGLDKLVDDDEEYVRFGVAERGYGLDKLVNDPDEKIRYEVARQGYGLMKLIFDKDPYVKQIAKRKLKELKNENK